MALVGPHRRTYPEYPENSPERGPTGEVPVFGTRTKMWAALKWPASSCSGKPPSVVVSRPQSQLSTYLLSSSLQYYWKWKHKARETPLRGSIWTFPSASLSHYNSSWVPVMSSCLFFTVRLCQTSHKAYSALSSHSNGSSNNSTSVPATRPPHQLNQLKYRKHY